MEVQQLGELALLELSAQVEVHTALGQKEEGVESVIPTKGVQAAESREEDRMAQSFAELLAVEEHTLTTEVQAEA